ncbi:class I SAM-dependent methyltransferase [Novosphingobium sp. KCTC 2891]|uniref:methyltransferase regulatory domain-containing protein n=1 Tax=Novosphingobium sp. KCTC 2891 TaxID=2989730 RepID=UPI00222282AB|nr:class I SAM-dependent methyltransferase [Novosphingobium sp. KCTC 2891]MCW1384099.1 class I SAM-dependent methyltransferase [Novosphingobium sp. KCTC 2891]
MSQAIDQTAGEPGGYYNSLPYDSMPFAHTQPSSLAALGTLLGLMPPNVSKARVLELGCASGGNILPLAARFPLARFTGIDLSTRHVDMANERIRALGLGNVAIYQGDLADPDVVEGEFDYIICHGVFSWVPRAAQEGILNICGGRLAPNGIAYVSYNVLPGWQLRQVIRDIFQFHTAHIADLRERVARGRWLLEQLANLSSDATPYGQLLRKEARQLEKQPDSYILGEFLVDENAPCYFHEFVERAERAGLAYLSDTDLHTSQLAAVSPDMNKLLTAIAGPGTRMAEQYFDFFQGRQFRQSLLVKAQVADQINRTIDHNRIAGLHFASKLRVAPELSKNDATVLRDPAGPTITTNDPAVAKALDVLGTCWPETRNLRQLLDLLETKGEAERRAVADRLLNSMKQIIVAGLITMASEPLTIGRAAAEKPNAWPLARYEAQVGQPWLTCLRHAPVKLDRFGEAVLSLLDGETDRATIGARLLDAIDNGTLRLDSLDGELETDGTRGLLAQKVAERVQVALGQIEALALLDPASS